MSKFVTGRALADVVYDILFEAKQQLVLVSPYIKLDDYFREILDRHAHNPELELIVVFGKNEGNVARSVSRIDLEYFAKFSHVTLVYAPTLHGKYYGNESKGVVTSINLYDYSFQNNIEFGVCTENTQLINKLLDRRTLDGQAFEQAMQVASSHDVIFVRRPVYKLRTGLMAKLAGASFSGKDYLEPMVLFDAIGELLNNQNFPSYRIIEFPKQIKYEETVYQVRPTREEVEARYQSQPYSPSKALRDSNPLTSAMSVHTADEQGYCIRTGVLIPFNPDRPLSYAAYKVWAEFGNENYPERFCHRTGKASHGKTSVRYPVLYFQL